MVILYCLRKGFSLLKICTLVSFTHVYYNIIINYYIGIWHMFLKFRYEGAINDAMKILHDILLSTVVSVVV